jgi:predicted nucleic acid-binding protein
MTTYVDSSVALRIALGARNALTGWNDWSPAVSSALIEVESLRTLDRLRLVDDLDDEELTSRREWIYDFLSRLEIIEVSSAVLARAAQPLPVPLKTLDAIHLASAMLWRETNQSDVVLATHDEALALAARTMGFRVMGV